MDTVRWTYTKTVVRRTREKAENVSKEIMIRKSPNLRNNVDTQIQKVQQTPNREIQRPTPRLIIIKLLKVKGF